VFPECEGATERLPLPTARLRWLRGPAENGRLDKIQTAENKDYQTAQQTLAKLEQLSNEQGSGQITLFF
jgi:hypothetical protein